jgi:hypothetical protein
MPAAAAFQTTTMATLGRTAGQLGANYHAGQVADEEAAYAFAFLKALVDSLAAGTVQA